jgi:hypothetical protein
VLFVALECSRILVANRCGAIHPVLLLVMVRGGFVQQIIGILWIKFTNKKRATNSPEYRTEIVEVPHYMRKTSSRVFLCEFRSLLVYGKIVEQHGNVKPVLRVKLFLVNASKILNRL